MNSAGTEHDGLISNSVKIKKNKNWLLIFKPMRKNQAKEILRKKRSTSKKSLDEILSISPKDKGSCEKFEKVTHPWIKQIFQYYLLLNTALLKRKISKDTPPKFLDTQMNSMTQPKSNVFRGNTSNPDEDTPLLRSDKEKWFNRNSRAHKIQFLKRRVLQPVKKQGRWSSIRRQTRKIKEKLLTGLELFQELNGKTPCRSHEQSMRRCILETLRNFQRANLTTSYIAQDRRFSDVLKSHHMPGKGGIPPNLLQNVCMVSMDTKEVNQTHSCKVSGLALYKGLVCSSISSLLFSLCAVIVKQVNNLHPGQLAIYRFIGITLLSIPILIHSRQAAFGPQGVRHFLFLRGIMGSINLFLNFLAYRYLPIGEASAVIFSLPVFVTIMARIFLKEPCSFHRILATTFTMVGLILITKFPINFIFSTHPDYNDSRTTGIVAGVVSLLFGSSVFILLRKLKDVHHGVILFNFGWIAILQTTALTVAFGQFNYPRNGIDQVLILGLSAMSFAGQLLLTLATRWEQAGPVSTVRSATDIIFAFIWQLLFFREIPDAFSICGALCVCVSLILSGTNKWQAT